MTEAERTAAFAELDLALIHVGLNFDGDETAEGAAELFCEMLGLQKREVPGQSFFAGTYVECMRNRGRGAKGHIGFATNDLMKTMDVMEANGFAVDRTSFFRLPDGRLALAYLQGEFFGFAVHFVQRF